MKYSPTTHLVRTVDAPVSPTEYSKSPTTAFLTHAAHLLDAVAHCEKHFPKKKDGTFTKASSDSLHQLCTSTFASMMSQFETFQKHLFAGSFEASRHIKVLTAKSLAKSLDKPIPIEMIASYRGEPTAIGLLVAESLPGWHDPERVNNYMRAFVAFDLYSNSMQGNLKALWQVRHTIVHTSGWLSKPDAQKVPELGSFADSAIVLGVPYVRATIMWFHRELKQCVEGYGKEFRKLPPADLNPADFVIIQQLFEVKSSRQSYFGSNSGATITSP